jgi:type I restriction enzyme S subunit
MSEIKQGYKQTKVGIIPEDWEDIKIKDIVKVSQGLQIAIDDRFTTPAHNRVFYITIPFIEGKKEEYIENPKSSTLCKKDDILVVRTGSGVGKIIRGVEGAFHNNFFKVKPSDNINIDFFYYFLTSPRVQFLMAKYAGNSAIPDLNHGDFYSLDFLIPPLKEQEKIAEILTTWDKAITKQTELLRAKELLKIALMQKLLSGEVRFDGFSDKWKEVRIDKLFDFKKGQELSKEKLEKNGIFECILYGELYTTYSEVISEIKSKTNIKEGIKSKIDDILIPASTTTSAIDLAIASTIQKDNVLIGGDINILRKKTNNINGEFISKYLTHIKKMEIAKYAQGITIIHLYSKDFKHLKIQLPSLPEQQKIAEVLSLADDEINLLKNELEELKLQKKALMQKLLTGEVRVKV